ncbi:MAG: hypothetical protein F6K30_16915 [Cyanothece sp. SIO2G6]|nr:hypothetical protein [Cyanothece sp. SIO2G6]
MTEIVNNENNSLTHEPLREAPPCSFTIQRQGGYDTYVFETKAQEIDDGKPHPIKIGDGSFGAVYAATIYGEPHKLFAVKLLYKSKSTSWSSQYSLVKSVIDSLSRESSGDELVLQHLIEKIQNLDNEGKISTEKELIEELSNIKGVTTEHLLTVLSTIHQNFESIPAKRFEEEMQAASTIRKNLREKSHDSTNSFEGVIETIGGSTEFHKTQAYKDLKESFESSGLEVSNYVLVMPKYSKNLKNLLEDKVGVCRVTDEEGKQTYESTKNISAELAQNSHEMTGYELLKSMDFDERVGTILPFLRKIAIGLKTLYTAELSHLDLKPSNIYLKGTENFDLAIGDLGFLPLQLNEQLRQSESIVWDFREDLPLGTLHYRSPEQKDFFDICDVLYASDSGECLKLTVCDPKFVNSIIEAGDWLVFSRDSTQAKYEIKEISPEEQSRQTTIQVQMSQGDISKFFGQYDKEKPTQVKLYKRQQVRTDLFGLGAIAFDMLTCGESPEKFYEIIRSEDFSNQKLENLCLSYQAISKEQSSDLKLKNMFRAFRDEEKKSYPESRIVEFILKCLFYRIQGNFYDEAGKNPVKAIDHALKSIEELSESQLLPYKKYSSQDSNKLFYGKPPEGSSRKADSFTDKLNQLQVQGMSQIHTRLRHGIWYFEQLVRLCAKTIRDESSSEIILREVIPNNLLIKRNEDDYKLDFDDVHIGYYDSEKDYVDAIREDSSTGLTRNFLDPYVPDYISEGKRRIYLNPINGDNNEYEYKFLDASPLGSGVSDGDYIFDDSTDWVIENSQGTSKKKFSLSLRNPQENESTLEPGIYEYWRYVDRYNYYLHMIGIYLYQIFFAGIGSNTVDEPEVITIARCYLQLAEKSDESPKITDGFDSTKVKGSLKQGSEESLLSIFEFMTRFYLRLTFSHDKSSFYSQYNSSSQDKKKISFVSDEATYLRELIAIYLGASPSDLRDKFPGILDEDPDSKSVVVTPDSQNSTQVTAEDSLEKLVKLESKLNFRDLVLKCMPISGLERATIWNKRIF